MIIAVFLVRVFRNFLDPWPILTFLFCQIRQAGWVAAHFHLVLADEATQRRGIVQGFVVTPQGQEGRSIDNTGGHQDDQHEYTKNHLPHDEALQFIGSLAHIPMPPIPPVEIFDIMLKIGHKTDTTIRPSRTKVGVRIRFWRSWLNCCEATISCFL